MCQKLLGKRSPVQHPLKGELAQLARALAWHARGQGFDSPVLHEVRNFRTFFMLQFIYQLYSYALDKYYVGYTSDIEKRLIEYNSGIS